MTNRLNQAMHLMSSFKKYNVTGLFCDPSFEVGFITKFINDLPAFIDNEEEYYGNYRFRGTTLKYYMNDNPPAEYEEDWVQAEVYIDGNPQATLGTMAVEREDWDKIVELVKSLSTRV